MTVRQIVDASNIRIAPLRDASMLKGFSSGEREVDRNIEKCCGWHEKYRNRIFCASIKERDSVVGFYCIGVSATESKYIDVSILRSDETFKFLPFVYINYIAVHCEYQNNKIGTCLLLNALEKCAWTVRNVGIYGVALHAISDRAAGLYDRYGFQEVSKGMKCPFMILPARSVLELFGNELA